MKKTNKKDLLQQHLASIISSSNDAIISISLDGKVKSWNAAAEKIFGYKISEVLGKPFIMLLPKKHIEENQTAHNLILKGKAVKEYETCGKNSHGKKFHMSVSPSPIYEGATITGISKIIKKTGAKFKIKPVLMLPGNHQSDFNNTFLSNMSHEIRTPLIAILGFTELLFKKDLQSQEMEYIAVIKDSGEYLLKMINDVLDISKIEGGMLHFEEKPFSVKRVFKTVERLLEHKVAEKKVEIKFKTNKSVPDILSGDPDKLTQILINLVSNAIKFTAKGKITVSAKALQDLKEHVRIEFTVKDTGIGLTKAQMGIIFDRFRQGNDDTFSQYGGSGLGLSIVKSMVELQGGKVSVKSKLNKGSSFTVDLCYGKNNISELNGTEEIKYDLSELQKLHVLLVEDNKLNVKLLESVFNSSGIRISLALNGNEAIKMIRDQLFDLILTDVEMPGMKGYELAAVIRKELMNNIPIIAMTAHTEIDLRDRCINAGMNGFISKPINREILFATMLKSVNQVAPKSVSDN